MTNQFDGRKDIGLSCIISICSYTQIDLLRVRVPLEGLGDPKNGVRGAHFNPRPPRAIQ